MESTGFMLSCWLKCLLNRYVGSCRKAGCFGYLKNPEKGPSFPRSQAHLLLASPTGGRSTALSTLPLLRSPCTRTHGLQQLQVLPLRIHLDPLVPPRVTFTHLAPDALRGGLPPSWSPRPPAGTGTSQKCPLLSALGQPPAGSHLNSLWVLQRRQGSRTAIKQWHVLWTCLCTTAERKRKPGSDGGYLWAVGLGLVFSFLV